MIQNDVLNTAKLEGRAEGRAEGREEGRAEGREEGRAEGRAEGREEGRAEGLLETARNLKRMGMNVDFIAQATGLSVDECLSL